MRFVILSFAVLGWVFYEMSGGADFRPPERPVQAANEEPAKPAAPAIIAPKKPVTEVAFVKPAELVAKPAVKPEATTRVESKKKKPAEAEKPASDAELRQVRTSLSQGLTLLPGSNHEQTPEQPLSLASLELGATGLQQVAPEAETVEPEATAADLLPVFEEPEKDIREVTGTRVNMRDGPGTVYPVIARLNIGHKLEVLGDSGTGWLRLRVLPEGHTGWISGSLVSKADP